MDENISNLSEYYNEDYILKHEPYEEHEDCKCEDMYEYENFKNRTVECDVEQKDVPPSGFGKHFYGETVSKTMSSNEILGDFLDIFIQASLGNLPKTSPEEIQQLLNERFHSISNTNPKPNLNSNSVDNQSGFFSESAIVNYREAYNNLTNVESQLPQSTVPTVEDYPKQHVRHELKRQRVDSDV